ncbi:MAG: hypothetical protein GX561_00525 [Lentisphaerae bacterium]|nr:hypothetical protein [Lentisphaerota bacterium]
MQSGGSSGSRREKEPCNWKTCLRKKQVSAYGWYWGTRGGWRALWVVCHAVMGNPRKATPKPR